MLCRLKSIIVISHLRCASGMVACQCVFVRHLHGYLLRLWHLRWMEYEYQAFCVLAQVRYDAELAALRSGVERVVVELVVGPKSSAATRKAILPHVDDLAAFLGRRSALSVHSSVSGRIFRRLLWCSWMWSVMSVCIGAIWKMFWWSVIHLHCCLSIWYT